MDAGGDVALRVRFFNKDRQRSRLAGDIPPWLDLDRMEAGSNSASGNDDTYIPVAKTIGAWSVRISRVLIETRTPIAGS